jgi:hypothetical protein
MQEGILALLQIGIHTQDQRNIMVKMMEPGGFGSIEYIVMR